MLDHTDLRIYRSSSYSTYIIFFEQSIFRMSVFFFFLIYSSFTMRVHVARPRKYVLKLANGVYIILTLFSSFSSCFSMFTSVFNL